MACINFGLLTTVCTRWYIPYMGTFKRVIADKRNESSK